MAFPCKTSNTESINNIVVVFMDLPFYEIFFQKEFNMRINSRRFIFATKILKVCSFVSKTSRVHTFDTGHDTTNKIKVSFHVFSSPNTIITQRHDFRPIGCMKWLCDFSRFFCECKNIINFFLKTIKGVMSNEVGDKNSALYRFIVLIPCFVIVCTFFGCNKEFELFKSSCLSFESSVEKTIKVGGVMGRFMGSCNTDLSQSRSEGFSEIVSGDNSSLSFLNLPRDEGGKKGSDQNGKQDWDEFFYFQVLPSLCAIWLLIFVVLIST